MGTGISKSIGVDIDNLYISQPDNGEQALEITETMVRSGAVDIVIVDSVAALVPKAEIEGDMGDSHVGLQARLMSQALRKLTAVISKSNCVVIFINQLREKVGVMFGNPETTTGGRALKFYASVRMDVRRIETLKQSGEMVGNRTRIRIVIPDMPLHSLFPDRSSLPHMHTTHHSSSQDQYWLRDQEYLPHGKYLFKHNIKFRFFERRAILFFTIRILVRFPTFSPLCFKVSILLTSIRTDA